MLRHCTLAVVVSLACACRPAESLVASNATLRLAPAELDFGTVYLGHEGTLLLEVENAGRAPLELSWQGATTPLFGELPAQLPSGTLEVALTFRPGTAGEFTRLLEVNSGELHAEITVRGMAREQARCPGSPCVQARFDPQSGSCVEQVLPDGTACEAPTACLTDTVCQNGTCVGSARSCDDANVCTIDVCHPERGCENLPAPPCPGDGKCQRGACDPLLGCGLTPEPDGTQCGPTLTCDAADVCIAGSCVRRDPPDGFECQAASPCQGAGRCQGSSCLAPAPAVLRPSWSFEPPSYDLALRYDGLGFNDFVMEPGGLMTVLGMEAPPLLRANSAHSTSADGAASQCVLTPQRLVCAKFDGALASFDWGTGKDTWTFSLRASRPDISAIAAKWTLYARRLMWDGQRVLAVMESRPVGSNVSPGCRQFHLLALSPTGALLSAERLADGFLDACRSPQLAGAAVDTNGEMYLSFHSTGAPRALLISVDHRARPRWRHEFNEWLGSLAVARGIIYPEHSPTAFSTAHCLPLATLATREPFGQPVVTTDRIIPNSMGYGFHWQNRVLSGYEYVATSRSLVERWTRMANYQNDHLRLASWERAPNKKEEVILTFTLSTTGQDQLTAISPMHGGEVWSCPIEGAYPQAMASFEVAQHKLGLNTLSYELGANVWGSNSAFRVYELPGVSISSSPWIGSHGGAAHTQREQ